VCQHGTVILDSAGCEPAVAGNTFAWQFRERADYPSRQAALAPLNDLCVEIAQAIRNKFLFAGN
jgi:hypothetical protein